MATGNFWGHVDGAVSRPAAELIKLLVRSAGANSNLLLNVGPLPDGTIGASFQQELAKIGQWMYSHGRSIYRTRGGPMPPQRWGVSTRSKEGDWIFLHILDASAVPRDRGLLQLHAPAVPFALVDRATLWIPSAPEVQLSPIDNGDSVLITVPDLGALDQPDYVVALHMRPFNVAVRYQERFEHQVVEKVMRTPKPHVFDGL
jgi:hypothetical protein